MRSLRKSPLFFYYTRGLHSKNNLVLPLGFTAINNELGNANILLNILDTIIEFDITTISRKFTKSVID